MRIVFKNSKIVFAVAKWSATGNIIKVTPSEASMVNLPSGVRVYSRNIVDFSKLKYETILNDSGIEVKDSSSYFDQFIPTFGNLTLQSNIAFSRIYYYDKDKNLLFRRGIGNKKTFKVDKNYNGVEVVYVKIQTQAIDKNSLKNMIVTRNEGDIPTSYEAYQSNSDGTIYAPYSWVYADDLREITITEK